jgi:hypothetical protein
MRFCKAACADRASGRCVIKHNPNTSDQRVDGLHELNPLATNRHRLSRAPEIIAPAVWLYFRLPLSLGLVVEMLLERGIVVSYETVRRGR